MAALDMAVQTNVSSGAGAPRLAVGRNTLSLLAVNFSSAGFALVISILIARGAGDAALGAYTLAFAWTLTLAQFADLGMNTLLTRDLAHRPELTAPYVRASLLAKGVIGVPLMIGLILAAPVVVQGETAIAALQFASSLIVINACYGTFTAVFRAFGWMMPILILNVTGLGVQAFVTWVLLQGGAGVEQLVILAVLVQVSMLAAGWVIHRRNSYTRQDETHVDAAYVRRLVRAGLPFAVAGILASIEMRANALLLGALDGDRAVGWYSAASRLVEGLRLAPNAFFGALLPALAALGAVEHRARFNSMFRRGELALLAFGGSAALLLSLLAPWLVPLLYGDAFVPAVPVLIVLSWSLVPALSIGLGTLLLYARHAEATVNRFLAAGLVLHVLLAVPLILGWSALGAALASLGSSSVICLAMLWYTWRLRRW
jgi:O-antigen/teichoic acid export membrane protein